MTETRGNDGSARGGSLAVDAGLQRKALACYLQLTAVDKTDWARRSWAGRLVLLEALDGAEAVAFAAMAAGAAVLWICADEAGLRASSLAGLTDFHVSSMSEALRILKNEIRKGQPVGVGVPDRNGSVWQEAVRRGVQPAALVADGEGAVKEASRVLVERGAVRLSGMAEDGANSALVAERAEHWRGRRAGDEVLMAAAEGIAEPSRGVALRWLQAAPRLFPRDRARWHAAAWGLLRMGSDAGNAAG